MRLIDADAAIDTIEKHLKWTTIPDYYPGIFEAVRGWLNGLPSIQPYTTTHDSIPAETGKNDGDKTSGECISRQVVAKFLDDWLFCLDENCHKQSASDLKMIIKDFKNLPSAQPETNCSEIPNNWIPCSERLPEESRKYLVTVLDGVGKRTTSALYHRRSKSWTLTGRMAYWKVIAWKPLPEPYQEEGEQDG